GEPVWISGRAGEAMICGGCHEDRKQPTTVSLGQRTKLSQSAVSLRSTTARNQRLNTFPTAATEIIGVGWDTQLQPIFDNNCLACHGDDNAAHIDPYMIVDPVSGSTLSWTFNLSGDPLPPSMAAVAGGGAYSKSYFSLAGPDMEAVERGELLL